MWQTLLRLISGMIFWVLHAGKAGSFPPALSPEEEAEALARMAAGDRAARQKLIEHNLRLVAHIVKKYGGSADPDDLISIGTIGLVKAVSTFNADKGIRLATYASRCIENEILMYFRAGRKTAQDVSISEPIETDRDGNALTLADVIADDFCLADLSERRICAEKLDGLLQSELTPRERKILALRYGLIGGEERPQREVARMLGISRSYVSRIEKKALAKLRAAYGEPDENG